MSCQRSPADGDVGAVACDFAPPVGLKLVPSYTFIWLVLASNHNSPLRGAVGAEVELEFSNNLTRFSFNSSPKPE